MEKGSLFISSFKGLKLVCAERVVLLAEVAVVNRNGRGIFMCKIKRI